MRARGHRIGMSLSFALTLLASACDGESEGDGADSSGVDAAPKKARDGGGAKPDAMRDAGSLDAARSVADASATLAEEGDALDDPAACSGALPVLRVHDPDTGESFEPDWSCYDGPEPLPADAGVRRVVFKFETLVTLLDGVTVDFFYGSSTLGGPALTRVFDGDLGELSFEAERGQSLFSVKVHALERSDPTRSVSELREYNFPIHNDGSPILAFAMLKQSTALALNLALEGDAPDPEKAILVTAARDCRGRDVSGGQFDVVDGETGLPIATGSAPGDARPAYFLFGLPDPSCTFTGQGLALWMLANAPVNIEGATKSHPYRLRFKGRRNASDREPVVLAETDLELVSGVTTIVRVHREHLR